MVISLVGAIGLLAAVKTGQYLEHQHEHPNQITTADMSTTQQHELNQEASQAGLRILGLEDGKDHGEKFNNLTRKEHGATVENGDLVVSGDASHLNGRRDPSATYDVTTKIHYDGQPKSTAPQDVEAFLQSEPNVETIETTLNAEFDAINSGRAVGQVAVTGSHVEVVAPEDDGFHFDRFSNDFYGDDAPDQAERLLHYQ